MRTGRRLTALGVAAAGLLLVGTAAPSLADTGLDGAGTDARPSLSAPAAFSAAPAGGGADAGPVVAAASDTAPDPATDGTDPAPDEPGMPPQCVSLRDPDALARCIIDVTNGCDDAGPVSDPCPPPAEPVDPCVDQPELPGCADNPQGGDQGAPPTPEQCAADPTLQGCLPVGSGTPSAPGGNGGGNGAGNGGGNGPLPGVNLPGQSNGHGHANGNGQTKGNGHANGNGAASAGNSPSAGGSVTTAQVEGTRPGAEVAGVSAGISACADVLCQSAVPVAAPVSDVSAAGAQATQRVGETMPQTGAPAHDRMLALLGAAMVAAGAALMRPRRSARHRRVA